TVIGNRPQFVKAAAVSGPLREAHEEILLHTGQHYDDELSTIFVEELGIPRPEIELGIGGGSNPEQTGRMLEALGPLLASEAPDAVLVYGDTNSTLAGAVAGAQAQVPVAHVEAGMRSGDRTMPEELNRILTDHASDLLLCPSQVAVENLAIEGLGARAELVGDVMVDVAELVRPRAAKDSGPLEQAGVARGGYVLATAHRAANVDDPERLARLAELLAAVPDPVVLPLHPRTRARLEEAGLLAGLEESGVKVLAPLGYPAFTALLLGAKAVLTDSGGVQKEAYLAGIPCVTLRDTTEWVETVDLGWNRLVDLDVEKALAALQEQPSGARPAVYGDGRAGHHVVAALSQLAG
ncbi:MAG: UDP-N-acetylglucosamine 2-epimerase (non-hydrolyzing), partial [Acidobacteria bacterium]|nr:UDP-N-acetylglucosamine 2-epimerase (non-hydrolyzing) [Acidobacteriota bacterium]